MKIYLKEDWDVPVQSPAYKSDKKEGHFVGRKKEIEAIFNEIKRKKHGSILISGYRGVGKTSTINKIMLDTQKDNKNIIPVLLNAAQLVDIDNFEETGNADAVKPNIIIKNLIRRLYKTTSDKQDLSGEIKKGIAELYKKAVSSEVNISESHEKQELAEDEETKESKFSANFDFSNLFLYISWAISLIFLNYKIQGYEWVSTLFGIIFLTIGVGITFQSKNSKQNKKKNYDETTAKEFYKFDATIGNLLFDLEGIHRDLTENKCKVIYIIDELDKIKPTEVTNILKYFKNFFTLSNAIFVFVGCESIWNKSKEMAKPDEHRSEIYTYFNSKYFLARPLWNELSDFIDEIIENSKSNFKKEDLETFKQVLFYDAKNDFFDLLTKLKDKITIYEDGFSIIEIKNFELDEIIKAKLYKIISIIFEQKYISYSHSKWEENEKLLKTLFSHAEDIRTKPGMQFSDRKTNDLLDLAVNDLYNMIYRLEGFNILQENDEQIGTIVKKVRIYKFVGDIAGIPSDNIQSLSSVELNYVATFERYMNYLIAVYNIYAEFTSKQKETLDNFKSNRIPVLEQLVSFEFNIKNLVDDHYKIYKNLINQNPPTTYKREEIEAKTLNINQNLENLKAAFSNTMLALMIRKIFPNYELQQNNLSGNGNLFGGSAIEIRNAIGGGQNVIVYFKDFSKQVMILAGRTDILTRIKKNIGENSQVHRVVTILEKDEDVKARGLHKIITQTPDLLFNTTVTTLRKLENFWKSADTEADEKSEN